MEEKKNNKFNAGDRYIVGCAKQEFGSIANNTTMALTGKTIIIAEDNKIEKDIDGYDKIKVLSGMFGECYVLAESLKPIEQINKQAKNYQRIISVDFDETIAYTAYPDIISQVPYSIETLKMLQEQGDIIILSTCREGQFLADALQWMKDRGFTPDCVNDNYPHSKHYHYGNCRKISGDIVIDDKNDNYTVDWLDIRKRLVKV